MLKLSMEDTLYDDSSFMNSNFRVMKRPATLELGPPPVLKRKKSPFSSTMLTSDDVNKLKLVTPEVEKFIRESFPNSGLKTPTPTLLRISQNGTETEEEFVKGFIDALANRHKNEETGFENIYGVNVMEENMTFSSNGFPTTSSSSYISTRNYTGLVPASHASTVSTAVISSMVKPSLSNNYLSDIRPPSVESSSSNSYPGTLTICALPKGMVVKEELQTVPSDSSSMGISPPMSPINLENQEQIKLERKRYRNRIAASKCRQRKLERISKLEDKVQELKNENSKLGNIANELRRQVSNLKEEVINHTKNGCKIMIIHDFS